MLLKIVLALALFVAVASSRSLDKTSAEPERLLDKYEFITEIDAKDFDSHVYCTGDVKDCTAHLVLFYTSKSELNRDFIPLVKEMAELTKGWRSIVNFAAVNCANAQNKELCTKIDFKRMAQLIYFNRNSKVGASGRPIITYTKTSGLITQLTKQLSLDMEKNGYESWPHFVVIPESTSFQELWDAQKAENFHLLLLIVDDKIDFETANLLIATKLKSPDLEVRMLKRGTVMANSLGAWKANTYLMLHKQSQPTLGVEIDPEMPKPKSYANLDEEYKTILRGTDFELFETYGKEKRETTADDDDDLPYTANLYIYEFDSKGNPPAFYRDGDYDGIYLKLKDNAKTAQKPRQSMALESGNGKTVNFSPTKASSLHLVMAPMVLRALF